MVQKFIDWAVKNALIVPVGSKGGFVVKQAPPEGGREGRSQYIADCLSKVIRAAGPSRFGGKSPQDGFAQQLFGRAVPTAAPKSRNPDQLRLNASSVLVEHFDRPQRDVAHQADLRKVSPLGDRLGDEGKLAPA